MGYAGILHARVYKIVFFWRNFELPDSLIMADRDFNCRGPNFPGRGGSVLTAGASYPMQKVDFAKPI
jgi:hypothetical protein